MQLQASLALRPAPPLDDRSGRCSAQIDHCRSSALELESGERCWQRSTSIRQDPRH